MPVKRLCYNPTQIDGWGERRSADSYFYKTPLCKQSEQVNMENMSVEALLACVFGRFSMRSADRTLCVAN